MRSWVLVLLILPLFSMVAAGQQGKCASLRWADQNPAAQYLNPGGPEVFRSIVTFDDVPRTDTTCTLSPCVTPDRLVHFEVLRPYPWAKVAFDPPEVEWAPATTNNTTTIQAASTFTLSLKEDAPAQYPGSYEVRVYGCGLHWLLDKRTIRNGGVVPHTTEPYPTPAPETPLPALWSVMALGVAAAIAFYRTR